MVISRTDIWNGLTVDPPPPEVALKLNWKFPDVVGVPLNVPPMLSDNPSGNEPLNTEKWNGGIPPVTVTCRL